jgi:thioredoxin reductase
MRIGIIDGGPAGIEASLAVRHANAFRNRAHPGSRSVAIGGGILGLECALRARERQMEWIKRGEK